MTRETVDWDTRAAAATSRELTGPTTDRPPRSGLLVSARLVRPKLPPRLPERISARAGAIRAVRQVPSSGTDARLAVSSLLLSPASRRSTMTTPVSLDRLAIDGGDPVRSDPMPPRIQMDERELDAVTGLFRRRMTEGGAFDRYDGPEVDIYEAELAEYFGVRYVTCVSAGT